MSLFNLDHVTYFYPGKARAAIQDLSIQINEGEFLLVLGPSASGKSSFVRLLSALIPSFYGGTLQGRVFFRDKLVSTEALAKGEIGVLFQNPERQIVTDRVDCELVYGMENLGMSRREMQKRAAEMIQYFNLRAFLHRSTNSLSGGEKQKTVLASVLAMGCRVLILDEPTSQLDPVAAEEVFALLRRFHQDFGYTIILVEHRSDECFALAERILFFDEGKLKRDLPALEFLNSLDSGMVPYLPQVSQVFAMAGVETIPVSVSDGQKMLKEMVSSRNDGELETQAEVCDEDSRIAISFDRVCFRYKDQPPFFERLNLTLPRGKSIAILGENGAGKSTLLKLAAGILTPQVGDVRWDGFRLEDFSKEKRGRMIGYVGQQPDDYLIHDCVFEECAFTLKNYGISNDTLIHQVLDELGIGASLKSNPRDLSFGERMRVAIASVLVMQPDILLLDEPVRGLDAHLKHVWGKMFQQWVSEKNRTVIFVTQDIDFAAQFSDYLIWVGAGAIVDGGPTRAVLENNLFFVPQAKRLFRNFHKNIWTVREAVQALKDNQSRPAENARNSGMAIESV